MKKILTVAAFAMLAASPALANSSHLRSSQISQSYASANEGYVISSRAPIVTGYGTILGADPDANVRLELQRAPVQFSGQ
jgi:hypothetical protein